MWKKRPVRPDLILEDDNYLYTIHEAAALVRVSVNWLKKRIRSGQIYGMILGNTWRIPRSSLTEFLSARKAETAMHLLRMSKRAKEMAAKLTESRFRARKFSPLIESSTEKTVENK